MGKQYWIKVDGRISVGMCLYVFTKLVLCFYCFKKETRIKKKKTGFNVPIYQIWLNCILLVIVYVIKINALYLNSFLEWHVSQVLSMRIKRHGGLQTQFNFTAFSSVLQ